MTDPTVSPPRQAPTPAPTLAQALAQVPAPMPDEEDPPYTLVADRARAHWETWRLNELAQMSDPQAFFDDLSRQARDQIEELADSLAGPDTPGERYLEKLGRLRMARFDAEAQVMRELVLLPPEPGHPDAETTETTEAAETGEPDPQDPMGWNDPDGGWLPVVMSPDHPRYHETDDDPGLRKI